ncbi:hypothetical protein GCM10023405_31580 [Streptomonospora salina]
MGLSQEDFGAVVDWSQKTVSTVENGRRDTAYDLRELLRVVDRLGLPRAALLPLVYGDDSSMSEIDRRTFTAGALGGLAALGMGAASVDWHSRKIGEPHVRALNACLHGLRNRDQSVGGGALLQDALTQWDWARQMLDNGDYNAATGRELLTLTADIGIISGWVAYDAGNQELARHLYTEAQLLANSTGDNELLAHVCANMATQSTALSRETGRTSRAREGLRLAEQAEGLIRREPSPRLHALVALRKAAAHARIGDRAAFRSSIGRARRDLDRGSHDTDPGWTGFVTPGEVDSYEAQGWLDLTEPARSVELYSAALEQDGLTPRNRTLGRSYLATALLHQGDIAASTSEGVAVLAAVESKQITSARIVDRLRPVRDADPPDAEFVERFDALALTPTRGTEGA